MTQCRRRLRRRVGASTRPLQAIGENTIVDLTADEPMLVSPSPQKPSKPKKRTRESTVIGSEKQRRKELETLLDELETQVQERCDELVAEANRCAQELEMELKVQLVMLPDAVRHMPWKTFCQLAEDFGGDMHSFIQSLSQSTQPSPRRTRSSVARYDVVASTPCSVFDPDESESAIMTPLDRRRPSSVLRTVSRTARKGEMTYSVRGSPIVPETVAKTKAPAGALVATFEKGIEPTSCCLQLDSERVVDLSRLEELSAESRGEATSKLQALQAKVAELLRQINSNAN